MASSRTDEKGAIKEQKLGRRAGKRGLGIGVALSVIAVMRRRDPSLRRNCAHGAGGEVVGRFFRQGLRVSGEDPTHIRRELNGECAAVEAVAEKLRPWAEHLVSSR